MQKMADTAIPEVIARSYLWTMTDCAGGSREVRQWWVPGCSDVALFSQLSVLAMAVVRVSRPWQAFPAMTVLPAAFSPTFNQWRLIFPGSEMSRVCLCLSLMYFQKVYCPYNLAMTKPCQPSRKPNFRK